HHEPFGNAVWEERLDLDLADRHDRRLRECRETEDVAGTLDRDTGTEGGRHRTGLRLRVAPAARVRARGRQHDVERGSGPFVREPLELLDDAVEAPPVLLDEQHPS